MFNMHKKFNIMTFNNCQGGKTIFFFFFLLVTIISFSLWHIILHELA